MAGKIKLIIIEGESGIELSGECIPKQEEVKRCGALHSPKNKVEGSKFSQVQERRIQWDDVCEVLKVQHVSLKCICSNDK